MMYTTLMRQPKWFGKNKKIALGIGIVVTFATLLVPWQPVDFVNTLSGPKFRLGSVQTGLQATQLTDLSPQKPCHYNIRQEDVVARGLPLPVITHDSTTGCERLYFYSWRIMPLGFIINVAVWSLLALPIVHLTSRNKKTA